MKSNFRHNMTERLVSSWPAMVIYLLLSALIPVDSSGQDYKAKESLRAGNSKYKEGDYDQALKSYEQANRLDSSYAKATYNLANAMYQKGDIEGALSLYDEASELFTDNKDKSRTHHNKGRSHLQSALSKIQSMAATGGQPSDQSQDPHPDLQAGLSEFKEALILDPTDDEARYNYGYTKRLMEKLPPSQDEQQDQQGDEGEDQENQEKQEDGQGEQDKEQKDQQNKQDQEQKDEQEAEPQEKEQNKQPQDPNRMNAEQQLDLLDQEEKDLQKQMSKERMAGNKVRVEKDW